jgi:hypothetical protein
MIFVAFLRGSHFSNKAKGVGFADPYWTQFWLTSYQDGFVRRSLPGTLLRLMFKNGMDVTYLSTIHIIISCALLLLVLIALFTVVSKHISQNAAVLVSVLLGLSPVAAMVFETTGDPLQLAILIFVACMLLTMQAAPATKLLSLTITSAVCLVIHEASLFFTLPYVILSLPVARKTRLEHLVITSWLIVITTSALVAILTSRSVGSPTFYVKNSITGELIYAASNATPGFGSLLEDEVAYNVKGYQGSITASAMKFVFKLVAFTYIPILVVLFVASYRKAGCAIDFKNYAYFLASCIPLLVIAHDWGRFAAFVLIMTIVASLDGSCASSEGGAIDHATSFGGSMCERLGLFSEKYGETVRALIFVNVLLCTILWGEYRVVGVKKGIFFALPSAFYLYDKRRKGERISG